MTVGSGKSALSTGLAKLPCAGARTDGAAQLARPRNASAARTIGIRIAGSISAPRALRKQLQSVKLAIENVGGACGIARCSEEARACSRNCRTWRRGSCRTLVRPGVQGELPGPIRPPAQRPIHRLLDERRA